MNIDDDDIVVELTPATTHKKPSPNDAWLEDSPAIEKIILKEPINSNSY